MSLLRKNANKKTRKPYSLKRICLALVLPCCAILIWEIAARSGWVPASILPAPSKVFVAFCKLLADFSLLRNSLISLARLAAGLLIGSIVGIIVGIAVGMSRKTAYILEPTLTALIPIPAVAWIPLLIIFFGIGEATNILLLAIGSFCVLFLQTLHGVRGVDQRSVEVGKVLRKGNLEILWHILLPGSMPSIFLGLRIALALSWTLLVASEMIASSSGLGWLIWNSRNFSRADEMLAGMIAIAIFGKITEFSLNRLEKYQLRWRATYENLNA